MLRRFEDLLMESTITLPAEGSPHGHHNPTAILLFCHAPLHQLEDMPMEITILHDHTTILVFLHMVWQSCDNPATILLQSYFFAKHDLFAAI